MATFERATTTTPEERTIAKAKAVAEWYETGDEFVEVRHGGAMAAVFHDTATGETVVDADGESGEPQPVDADTAALVAAARALDEPSD